MLRSPSVASADPEGSLPRGAGLRRIILVAVADADLRVAADEGEQPLQARLRHSRIPSAIERQSLTLYALNPSSLLKIPA